MGADAAHLFYGVRYQVSDDAEIKLLQANDHPLAAAAKKCGLQTDWGNFDFNGGEYYLLYIGRHIATLGHEGAREVELSDTALIEIQMDTRRKLSRCGFSLTPAFFGQFEPDV